MGMRGRHSRINPHRDRQLSIPTALGPLRLLPGEPGWSAERGSIYRAMSSPLPTLARRFLIGFCPQAERWVRGTADRVGINRRPAPLLGMRMGRLDAPAGLNFTKNSPDLGQIGAMFSRHSMRRLRAVRDFPGQRARDVQGVTARSGANQPCGCIRARSEQLFPINSIQCEFKP